MHAARMHKDALATNGGAQNALTQIAMRSRVLAACASNARRVIRVQVNRSEVVMRSNRTSMCVRVAMFAVRLRVCGGMGVAGATF